jgi:hypothetical protein
MAITGKERQILMAELAEIAMELEALQERTTEITARVARRPSIHLAQSA